MGSVFSSVLIQLVLHNTTLSYCMIVLYSRDHKGLGVAHEKMTMKQLGPNKPSDRPETLSTSCYGNFFLNLLNGIFY